MKADLSLEHSAFDRYFPSLTDDRDSLILGSSLRAWLQQAWRRLGAALRPLSGDEAYLAEAQNHADFERRLFELQYARHHLSPWQG